MKKQCLTLLTAIGFSIFAVIPTSYAGPIQVLKNSVIENANLDKLWAIYGGFCAISNWHLAVENCEINHQDSVKIRTFALDKGQLLYEEYISG